MRDVSACRGRTAAKTQLTLFIFVYSALAFGGAREQAVFSVRACTFFRKKEIIKKTQKNQYSRNKKVIIIREETVSSRHFARNYQNHQN